MALAVVSSIIEKLKDPLLEEVHLIASVSSKVGSVRQTLEWIKLFLEDAENRSNESKVIKHWVAEVREVAYRIEDAIDIYVIEIRGERLLGSHFIAWVYKSLTLKKPIALHKLGVELQSIEATLQKIDENRKLFDINDLGESSRARAEVERPPTLEYIDDESRIVGLEVDKIVLAKLLQPHSPGLSVISIVGTGGLGKTTLAQKIFNSAKVKEKFDIRIWVCVSKEINRDNILKKMLEDIRKLEPEEKDRDEVYFKKEIRKFLTNKRFLIVLDDVWSETFWPDHIRVVCPPVGELYEGQVLITTRDHNVAEKAEGEIFELQFLNAKESKMLFYKIVFPKQTPPVSFDLLATELVKKCGGLPLAIVVLGGRLRMKKSYAEWRKVADSIDWRGSKCMQILAASYDDMSFVMKLCFMYLASFPEDYEIDAKSLVRTWVAEDIVSDEIIAENCLEELVQRCMVIACGRSYDGSLEQFRLHDLLRELASREAKENKFLSVFVKESPHQNSNNARRASLQSHNFSRRFSSNFEETTVKRKYNKKLRSLLIFNESLPDDLSGYRLLKVLIVHSCYISSSKLKKLCEKLIHLRHLEFRDCYGISKIPESIGRLKNLLTLDCTGTYIKRLPKSLWSITTLRHILVLDGPKAPPPSAYQSNLKTLLSVEFELPKLGRNGWNYGYLSNLHELALENADPWVATLLKQLNQLVSLYICNRSKYLTLDVLDMRVFPFYESLQCLGLYGSWPEHVELQAHLFPPHLTKLYLSNCHFMKDPMPILEQLPNLQMLYLNNRSETEDGDEDGQQTMTMTCSAGGFSQLQKLILEDFPVEEFRITPGAMPILKQLHMSKFGLKSIPELQHLEMLQYFEWADAPYTEERIQVMQEENQHRLQHIPSVTISSISRKIRAHAGVIRAAWLFKEAAASK